MNQRPHLMHLSLVALILVGTIAHADVIETVEVAAPEGPLGGTLVLPDGAGPFPAVLIVQASGGHPRDEARSGGAHWAALAPRLAEVGVASLRVDGRGHDAPEDAPLAASAWTPDQLLADAHAALDTLRGHSSIDPSRVGLIGFMDGGLRAGRLAQERPDEVAGVALLSVSGVSMADDLHAMQMRQAVSMGHEGEALERIRASSTTAIDLLVNGGDRADQVAAVVSLLNAMGLPTERSEAMADAVVTELSAPGNRALLGRDPAMDLSAIPCPVLVVNGGAELARLSAESMPRLVEALGVSSRPDVEILVLGGRSRFLEDPADAERDHPVFDAAVVQALARWVQRVPRADGELSPR